MTLWVSIVTFLVALPFAVWFLAALLSTFDAPLRTRALLRVTLGVVAILLLAVFLHRQILVLFSWAFIVVTSLHIIWFFISRWYLVGVPQYEIEPVTPNMDLPDSDTAEDDEEAPDQSLDEPK